tara:strand:- start:165 stop:1325 length:1161 start_codon:yes stop_codon:yes gene_type:complete
MRFNLFFILIFLNLLISECSDLNEAECNYWSAYCTWDASTNACYEEGSGGGGGDADGPYEYSTITESQGLRNGPDYRDGVLYYPIDANPPYKNIVLTPGFGGGSSSMASWGAFFASYGYVAMTIGPNDEINDSHYQRGEGLIDGIETITQENSRFGSPVFGLLDIQSFVVSGYSMGGGASHDASLIAEEIGLDVIKALISLNPTVIFEDCDLCPANNYEGEIYCICLVPELIEHSIPSLIFAGQFELDELTAYDGLLGQDIYYNLPETTQKILIEVAGEGHGAAAYPYGEVSEYILTWLDYKLKDDIDACESLLIAPSIASLYDTNIECTTVIDGDINEDSLINIQDVILTVNLILNNDYSSVGDLNYDGALNIQDIILLINIILN